MMRTLFVWIFMMATFPLSSVAQRSSAELAKLDVDSMGDLWIFTLDKTGSMLSEVTITGGRRAWTTAWIKDDVIKKLNKTGGILDQIDYSRDRVSIMETGYGRSESDSYGNGFCAAPPLDSCFIHVISSNQRFINNQKEGLVSVLSQYLAASNYYYRESFVSQIRVLSLHRLVKLIAQQSLGSEFREIHIVTITDDADVNDQWRMDYYTIRRDPKKVQELNELNSRYVYSSFTQKGAGYLDEQVKYQDVSSKNHIYMYDYVTRQQKTSEIVCREDSVIKLAPLNGKSLNFQLSLDQIASDKICFAYIDSITINQTTYPICEYMEGQKCLEMAYDMDAFRNNIVISGKIQVQYQDSIYGLHYKTYDFVQYNEDYSASVNSLMNIILGILILAVLFVLLFVFFILPYRRLLTVHTLDGQKVRVRRGYRWQWDRVTPLLYSNDNKVIFAQHPCYKRISTNETSDHSNVIVIDSPVPLTFSGNVMSDSTRNNVGRNIETSHGRYPVIIQSMYGRTFAGHIVGLRNSRFRWVRQKFYPVLNRWAFQLFPHYYYWGNGLTGLISMPSLRNNMLLLESKKGVMRKTYDDRWLNAYYQGKYPKANVLICMHVEDGEAIWDVYQLRNHKSSSDGIESVRHLIHYRQNKPSQGKISAIRKRLKDAISQEMGIKDIVFMDTMPRIFGSVHFNVTEASCMAYVCLVEHTLKEKCQVIYSPLTDAEYTKKDIVIEPSTVSRLVWTSLVPFTSKKDRPVGDVANCESLDIIREGASCQKTLSVKQGVIEIDNIRVKSERTI